MEAAVVTPKTGVGINASERAEELGHKDPKDGKRERLTKEGGGQKGFLLLDGVDNPGSEEDEGR